MENTFADKIIDFYLNLKQPEKLPSGVEVLIPFKKPEVKSVIHKFYTKFYSDNNPRIFLIGINPGRFGAGITGINFTDPFRLREKCGITENFEEGKSGTVKELSSDFVYRMIDAFGGTEKFFGKFYLAALSPLGYVRDGKNFNYYDINGLPEMLDMWMADSMRKQIAAGADVSVGFSMGMGENFRQLEKFNSRHSFFDRVEKLPHPRWIMQYRRRRLDEYIELYVNTLNKEAAEYE